MRRSDVDAILEELYEQVPQPDCKGLCVDSCGPIDMNPRERQRIRGHGYTIPGHAQALRQMARDGEYACPALTSSGACGAHEVRPMICRLWGAVESMPCPHGCRPEGGLLPDRDGMTLLAQSIDAGSPTPRSQEDYDRVRRMVDNPQIKKAFQTFVGGRREF